MIESYILKANIKADIENYYMMLNYLEEHNRLKVPKRHIGSLLHEYVLGLLFEQARLSSFFPLPEYMPYEDSKHRIDMIWLDKYGKILAGFEVDRTVYPKSVKKLLSLPVHSTKVIVSIGLGKRPLDKQMALCEGIEVWDFTQCSLHMNTNTR